MKMRTSLILLLSSLASPSFALGSAPTDPDVLHCYAHAMVGFDSVINSRLDVPPELSVGLAIKNPTAAISYENYSHYLVKVVLDAYMWDGSPHSYAVDVFYYCAQKGAMLTALE